jgi:hypothetical protein
MSAQQQDRELTLNDVMVAAARAYDNLNSNGWGEVYVMFIDADRNTQAIMYISPSEDDEMDTAADECLAEVQDALQTGWRPVCLQVLPYADPIIVPLRNDLSIDDQAVIWGWQTDEEENGTGLEADSSKQE